MEIKRINTYTDRRFSEKALLQHGCFLADGKPCEVEIFSEFEAVIRGEDRTAYPEVLEEFRFYAPHITVFYDGRGNLVREYPGARLLTLPLERIQPSQFFVDEDKIRAVSGFIHRPEDIIIQVLPHDGQYIALDGHTRLYLAVMKGWAYVRGVIETSDDWIHRFVAEAHRRNIHRPKDMALVSHAEYEEKWNGFCDEFFARGEEV